MANLKLSSFGSSEHKPLLEKIIMIGRVDDYRKRGRLLMRWIDSGKEAMVFSL